jgi:hypothetical protein
LDLAKGAAEGIYHAVDSGSVGHGTIAIRPSVESVRVPIAAEELVVATAAEQEVGTIAPEQPVGTGPSLDQIRASRPAE